MFTFLPLYYTDNYYNILHDKRNAAVGIGIALLAVLLTGNVLGWIPGLLSGQKVKAGRIDSESIQSHPMEVRSASVFLLDALILGFAAVSLLSSAWSADPEASFTGADAWDVGSGMILLMTLIYFVISRNPFEGNDVWFYILVGSFAVVGIGVIDRLGYDVLIMHDEIPLQYNIFVSTIGNVNFWAAYLSMLVPLFAAAPIFLKHRFARVITDCFLLVAYFACFITLTNTSFLGIGGGMLVVAAYSCGNKRWLKTLAINMILFMFAGAAARILWVGSYTPRPIDTDSIAKLLLTYRLYDVVGAAGIALPGLFKTKWT